MRTVILYPGLYTNLYMHGPVDTIYKSHGRYMIKGKKMVRLETTDP